jgi:hypothetical protein
MHAGIADFDQAHTDLGIKSVFLMLDQADHASRVECSLARARLMRSCTVSIGSGDQVHRA